MSNPDKSQFSRRHLMAGALAGAAPFTLGMAAFAQAKPGPAGGLLNVRDFGAKGDGKALDTQALQRTLDAAAERQGAVFIPPGVYRSGELQLRPHVSVVAIPSWDYGASGDTAIVLADPKASCLLNMTGARGITLDGLALDGGNLGSGIHGIFLNKPKYEHEDSFRIERCRVARFTGDGLSLKRAWCFSVRHSMLAFNGGDGLRLRGWDGFIMDNWFSGNRGTGFGARGDNASVTMTANRIEWNHQENVLIKGGNAYIINGNFFDRAGTSGLALVASGKVPCSEMTITGNYFRRSGKFAKPSSHDSSHIRLDHAEGIACVGNSLRNGRDDGSRGLWSPSYGIVYKNIGDSVITNNVLHGAAMKQLFVDLGGHAPGLIVKDNPGRVFVLPKSES